MKRGQFSMTNPIWREKGKYYEGRDNWHGSVQRDNINRFVGEMHVRLLCSSQLWFSFLIVLGISLTVYFGIVSLSVQLRLKYTHQFDILMTTSFLSRHFFSGDSFSSFRITPAEVWAMEGLENLVNNI